VSDVAAPPLRVWYRWLLLEDSFEETPVMGSRGGQAREAPGVDPDLLEHVRRTKRKLALLRADRLAAINTAGTKPGPAASAEVLWGLLRNLRLEELENRCTELRELRAGWNGRGSVAPPATVVANAQLLGREVVEHTVPSQPSLNLGAADDGSLQFTVFGVGGRELELWLDESPGVFTYAAIDSETSSEGQLPIERYRDLVHWLNGSGALPR